MNENQTYAPGEIFQSAGKTWQVVADKSETCERCEAKKHCFDMPLCSGVFRLDRQGVIFKKIITA
jgi:hypothetical protein